jgi:hypothetical protein
VTLEDKTRDEGGEEKSFKAVVVLSYSIICMEISLIFVVFIELHACKLIQLLVRCPCVATAHFFKKMLEHNDYMKIKCLG